MQEDTRESLVALATSTVLVGLMLASVRWPAWAPRVFLLILAVQVWKAAQVLRADRGARTPVAKVEPRWPPGWVAEDSPAAADLAQAAELEADMVAEEAEDRRAGARALQVRVELQAADLEATLAERVGQPAVRLSYLQAELARVERQGAELRELMVELEREAREARAACRKA